MRYSSASVIVCATMLFSSAWARPVNVMDSGRIGDVVDTTTFYSRNADFLELDQHIQNALRKALQGGAPQLTRSQLEKVKQSDTLADWQWLKQSGYDFHVKQNQQAGIELLQDFSSLSPAVLARNLAIVTQINRDATQGQRQQALVDAEGQSYLFFLADALGPRLGKAFLAAYQNGEIDKAAALIKKTEISTGAAKDHFNYPRPFLRPGNQIHLVPDDMVVQDNKPYGATGGSFPSGHTNTGYTDALLMGEMIPERFLPLVDRGARYGYSRIILGVHYPLDIIGSRMVAERNVAHFLNDPKYRVLFDEAKQQLRAALAKECGEPLAECAKNQGAADPYFGKGLTVFYRYTMTYGLPADKNAKARPVKVPEGAEILLAAPLPRMTVAQRRALMAKTAIPNGYPLSAGTGEQNFWQRLDLHDAMLNGMR
ncbi:acid phosphatase [Martelella alba]|uniref:Phosphatase PAP2 family protein n=1 Tax=Martelella alba TaxID=2590451 RepID=A0ABY2SQS3_9HYPH|nr:phosphatase PAP2 family protein [Martelella alba]TKI07171.1 phosphatase PAP2 family protein [Martelella alba]